MFYVVFLDVNIIEIKELKQSIVSETQPQVKIFVFKIGGQITTEGLTAADVDEYAQDHPYTKVSRLQRANQDRSIITL
jgi:hypothetical protein